MIDNEVVDLTIEQFNKNPIFVDRKKKLREDILKNEDTLNRYNILKDKVDSYISKLNDINDYALNCNSCYELVKNFGTSETIHFGKVNNILVLGEASANNGWRKSGKCWYGADGKITASGKVMNKLLEPYNLIVDDITFLEAVKCFPKERKNLKKCSSNCNYILNKQIKLLKPKK